MLNRGAALNFRELLAPPNSTAWAAAWRPYVEPCIELFGAEALSSCVRHAPSSAGYLSAGSSVHQASIPPKCLLTGLASTTPGLRACHLASAVRRRPDRGEIGAVARQGRPSPRRRRRLGLPNSRPPGASPRRQKRGRALPHQVWQSPARKSGAQWIFAAGRESLRLCLLPGRPRAASKRSCRWPKIKGHEGTTSCRIYPRLTLSVVLDCAARITVNWGVRSGSLST
jgi:hypothetical protein